MDMLDTGEIPVYRIFAIDPGTSTLGVSILDVDPDSFIVTVSHALTIKSAPLIREYEYCAQLHGEKVAKLFAMQRAILKLLNAWNPEWIISESPYMGRFPQAFAALTECLDMIRRAVLEYSSILPLDLIDPSSVKKGVGVNGKSSDKDLMTKALKNLVRAGRLKLADDVDLDDLDEHAIDASAVGYSAAVRKFKL